MAESYSNVINQYSVAFKGSDFDDMKKFYKIAEGLYHAMYQHYEYCEEKKLYDEEYKICQLIDRMVLDKMDRSFVFCKNINISMKIVQLRKEFLALSARRNLKNFAFYIEQYKNKKVWDKTMDTMYPVFFYADRLMISGTLNIMRASMMPSMGKSYFGNLLTAQTVGNDPNYQILRVSYSDHNAKNTTKQTVSIIDSQAFREIFPRYKKYEGKNIFKGVNHEMFCMIDNEDEYNLFSVTRGGQSNGKRCDLVIIDDLLKGAEEAYSKDLHKKLLNMYDSDWSSRAQNEKMKILLLGTMWADTDLLNVLYDRESEFVDLIPDPNLKYVEVAKNGTSVWIGIPALDEHGRSTCPQRYSTVYLKNKKKTMDKFLWRAVYQQQPIAPEGLDFDWSNLILYDEKPTGQTECRYASLDPARKGKNYVSMPIFYQFRGNDKFTLVDFLYKKKSMKELYDPIVDKIIEHKINKMILENNTDTSLKMVLDTKLHEKGYYGCTIIEKYSSQNKEKRINDHQGDIRGMIEYPRKGLFLSSSEMGRAMDSLTSFSFNYPNKYDDAIDSICLFVMEFISNVNILAKARGFDRRRIGM